MNLDAASQQALAEAFSALQKGATTMARQKANAVLEVHPHLTDALMAAGLSWLQEGQVAEAIPLLARAVDSRPGKVSIWMPFLHACKQAGEHELAANLIEEHLLPLTDDTTLPEALIKPVVETLEAAGRYDSVIALLECYAPNTEVDTAWSLGCQAWNHELLNQLPEAEGCATRCVAIEPDNFRANSVLARLALRQRQPSRALEYLDAIGPVNSPLNQALSENIRAQALEMQARYEAAFTHYRSSNELVRKTVTASGGLNPYSMALAEMLRKVRWDQWPKNAIHREKARLATPPVFLLGFPRAGTTLLEKMLQAHPRICSLEEKPLLAPVFRHFLPGVSTPAQMQKKLEESGKSVWQALRAAYLEQQQNYLGREAQSGEYIIDKMPLNVMYLGLLAWLFPEAHFILAVRDPRDVALSCYFQLFQPNPAMQHFLDWQQTARFLNATMMAGLSARAQCEQQVLMHKYEDFVANPKAQVENILTRLGLAWDPAMATFQDKLKGTRINTPSYQRVTQPIDRSRTQRWKNFRPHIEQVIGELHPVMQALGYD